MELKVFKADGSEAGRTVTLDEQIFGIEPNDHVIWLEVRRIQANARQGTHKVKERAENAHSTRKLYRQKGTGNARAGSAKSPLRRGGGTTFGPRPRTYGLKLNKKTRRLARRSALSYKAQLGALRVVEGYGFDAPSSRQLADLVETLDLGGQKVLMLTAGLDTALYRSCGNFRHVKVEEARNVSALDVLAAAVVVVEEKALDVLGDVLGTAAPATA